MAGVTRPKSVHHLKPKKPKKGSGGNTGGRKKPSYMTIVKGS
jgi:hypothetical protein